MNSGRLIISQLMDFLPMHEFRRCTERYEGNKTSEIFLLLGAVSRHGLCSIDSPEILRDIEACLKVLPKKRYHMGIKDKVARSTIAEANERRDWRIYADQVKYIHFRFCKITPNQLIPILIFKPKGNADLHSILLTHMFFQ